MAKQKTPQRPSKSKPAASARATSGSPKKSAVKAKPAPPAKPAAAKPAPVAKGALKPGAKAPPAPAKKPLGKPPARPGALGPGKAAIKGPLSKPGSKPAPAPAKGAKPPATSGKKKPEAPPPPPAATMADMRAAASRLAAAAGLHPVRPAIKPADASASRVRKPTKTPLTREDLDHYRAILIQKRAEIAGDVSTLETEALSGGGSGSLSHLPQHMADQGSDVYDQTLSLDLAASQRKLLTEIDHALERIAGGTYGVCSVLGIPIGKQRLDAKPWAKTSIEAARMAERGAMPA